MEKGRRKGKDEKEGYKKEGKDIDRKGRRKEGEGWEGKRKVEK